MSYPTWLLERYEQGVYIAVWDDLSALADEIRQPPLYTDAWLSPNWPCGASAPTSSVSSPISSSSTICLDTRAGNNCRCYFKQGSWSGRVHAKAGPM